MFHRRLLQPIAKIHKLSVRTLVSSYPRRSLLYMPINNPKFIKKAESLNVDTICFDLEDAVAPNQKISAREYISQVLSNKSNYNSEVSIRINPYKSGLEFDDIMSVLNNSSNNLPDSICLPKCSSNEDIEWLDYIITKELLKKNNRKINSPNNIYKDIQIIGMIETPNAVVNASKICSTTLNRLSCVIFGGDDYASTVNAVRTTSNHEINNARNITLLHAKMNELQCIDIVNINFKDTTLFEKECVEGFELGFDGKQCIHPIQAELSQKLFSPSKDRIDWALKVVNAFSNESDSGIGAFELDGQMIDMPTVKQAQNLVQKAKKCNLI